MVCFRHSPTAFSLLVFTEQRLPLRLFHTKAALSTFQFRVEVKTFPTRVAYLLLVLRLAGLRRLPAPIFSCSWILWALTMAVINPGKRLSISAQREVLCISTPRRSPRIKPASLRALKCWERVDLGMVFSLTFRNSSNSANSPSLRCGQRWPPAQGRRARGECASTVTSSIEGEKEAS